MSRRYAVAVVLVGLTTTVGCSDEGSGGDAIDLPSPSRSITREPTREPTRSATEPTREPTRSATEPTTAAPSATVTVTDTATPTPTVEATPTTSPAPDDTAEDTGGAPSWVWWLAGAAVVALLAVPLLVRSRRRGRWVDGLAAAEGEVAWIARQLVPELRHDLGAWTPAAAGRVAATEDRLTVLADRSRSDQERARALALRDAARDARVQIDEVATTAGPARERLDAVQERLEGALRES